MGSLPSLTEVSIDAARLKFFNSKVKIWEYAKISANDFQKLSFQNRSLILKNYHFNMSTKYSMGSGIMIVFFCLSLTIFCGSLFVPWLKKIFLLF